MVYECRLNRVRGQHVYTGLLTIFGLYLLSVFEVGSSTYWWSYSIGVLLAIAIIYLIGNTKVRIEITEKMVTIYHSGMVQGNIRKTAIEDVVSDGNHTSAKILITTNDGQKYIIPIACFSSGQIESLIKEIDSA